MSPSPVQESIGDLPDSDKSLALKLGVDTEELCVNGTAFYALQSSIDHICQPNVHAIRSEQDLNCSAVIIAKHSIPAGEEVTTPTLVSTGRMRRGMRLLKIMGLIVYACFASRSSNVIHMSNFFLAQAAQPPSHA